MKFGGTSVGSAEAIRQVAAIVQDHHEAGHRLLVVCSAMSGVTDILFEGARTAAGGDATRFRALAHNLHTIHDTAIKDLVTSDVERIALHDEVGALIDEFETLCYSIHVLREASPKALDKVSSLGERMCVPIVAALLRQYAVPSQAVNASHLIITDDQFQNAGVFFTDTEASAQRNLLPLLQQGFVPVVTGFLGATRDGVVTTLGRSGSDYTATLLGAYVGSDEVWIWTDVDGVMSADPRIVPEARVIPSLSYNEVGEMAYFGAKVIHPKTVQPAIERGIPIWVKNTFDPALPGTVITEQDHTTPGTVKAVTAIRDVSLVTVTGRGMAGVPGIAARTFLAVARQNASVLLISQSSSQQSLCFVVPEHKSEAVVAAIQDELAHEFGRHDIEAVWADKNINIATVVGAGMRTEPGVAAAVFHALGNSGVNIQVMAQGSSEYCLSMVMDASLTEKALQEIHKLIVVNGKRGAYAPTN